MHRAGETCYQDFTTILEPGLENLLAFPLGASTDQRGMVNLRVHRYADEQVQLLSKLQGVYDLSQRFALL